MEIVPTKTTQASKAVLFRSQHDLAKRKKKKKKKRKKREKKKKRKKNKKKKKRKEKNMAGEWLLQHNLKRLSCLVVNKS